MILHYIWKQVKSKNQFIPICLYYSFNLFSNISTIVFSVPTILGDAINPICFIVNSGVFPFIPCIS